MEGYYSVIGRLRFWCDLVGNLTPQFASSFRQSLIVLCAVTNCFINYSFITIYYPADAPFVSSDSRCGCKCVQRRWCDTRDAGCQRRWPVRRHRNAPATGAQTCGRAQGTAGIFSVGNPQRSVSQCGGGMSWLSRSSDSDVWARDHCGCSALDDAANTRSPLREDIWKMMFGGANHAGISFNRPWFRDIFKKRNQISCDLTLNQKLSSLHLNANKMAQRHRCSGQCEPFKPYKQSEEKWD